MEATLEQIREAEARIDAIEAELIPLRQKVASMDAKGNGVRVLYDYDLGWIVDEMNEGEWEVQTSFTKFSDAVENGKERAEKLGVGIEIDGYLPPRKFRYKIQPMAEM